MKSFLEALSKASPATQSIILRTWANSAIAGLVGKVAGIIKREQRALAQGGSEAYSDMREDAEADNATDVPAGGDSKLTLNLLVEWAAAVAATAMTSAEQFEGTERRYAQPMSVKDTVDFMATPKTQVSADQIDAVLEEEDTYTREQAAKVLQLMAIADAQQIKLNESLILGRVEELLNDAPHNREFDTIVADLPEEYQARLLEKACTKVLAELDRTLPLAIRGVPGISAKRRLLKADLPALEAAA